MKIAQFYHNQRLCLGEIEDNVLKQIDFQGEMIDFIKGIRNYRPIGGSIPLDGVQSAPPVIHPLKFTESVSITWTIFGRAFLDILWNFPKLFRLHERWGRDCCRDIEGWSAQEFLQSLLAQNKGFL